MDNIEWTDKQKLVFDLKNRKDGCFVVKACPGSGKTACVSERLFRFIEEWDDPNTGIAVLSFTKVALEEISKNYEEKSGNSKVPYPHYVGTLDSFINKFIFLPHSHLVMGYDKKPTFVGKPYSHWSGSNDYDKFFDKLTFSKDGGLDRKLTPDHIFPSNKNAMGGIKSHKIKLIRESGLVTQSDADYYAMLILQKFPEIAKYIATRFPYLIIDEAQDTSEIHMEIIDLLISNGLNNVILVGDPEQAIFEWNDAKPSLFDYKYEKWENDSIILDTNFRSSNSICKFISKLSELDNITSGNSIENISPTIIGYSNNLEDIIDTFLNDCDKNGISRPKDSVAVLFRGNNDISKLKNKKTYYLDGIFKGKDYKRISITKDIINGKFLWDNKNLFEGFNYLEKAFIKLKYDATDNIEEKIREEIRFCGICNHRENVYNFIKLFPEIRNNQNIQDWINKSNEILSDYGSDFSLNVLGRKGGEVLSDFLTFDMVFVESISNERDYYLGTIHSVKGESYDAVLVILNSRFSNEKNYVNMLNDGDSLKNSEGLRVVYVAITRPRKLLRIAVPKDDLLEWKKHFNMDSKEDYNKEPNQQYLDNFF